MAVGLADDNRVTLERVAKGRRHGTRTGVQRTVGRESSVLVGDYELAVLIIAKVSKSF